MQKHSALLGLLVAVLVSFVFAPAHAEIESTANKTLFGPRVFVFDATMPAAEIQATATEIFQQMESNQFGSERYAILFKPGTYDVNFNVGFYTHVGGLGQDPDDVQINGGVNVNAQWMPNANATCNFWRSLENFAVTPSATEGVTRIALSQAAPLRRLHVKGSLHLFDFDSNWNAGWASGGFLADSIVDEEVVPASQQQWFSRNSKWDRWSNGVWNMMFLGCPKTPDGRFPDPPYTVIEQTPVIREKPYLYIDDAGEYAVFVPSLQRDRQGVSWESGSTPGKSVSLQNFHIAQPETSTSETVNAALSAGKHILFTPGIYSLDAPIHVTRPETIVLGLGVPSLIPSSGDSAIVVDDLDGVTIAGLILDAGPENSTNMLQVGKSANTVDHSSNPTFLYDLTVRTGGPVAGKNDIGIEINSNHVVADQLWLWRADHGEGVSWDTNPTKNGIVVHGEDVTIYGLFNEHHEEYQTLWTGNGGRVYFYQSEMPYDVPDQASWMSGKSNGFASYKVADDVKTHEAWGLGVYAYFRDAAIKADRGIEAPNVPGVKFHSMTTIWLNGTPGSEITHVINDLGGRVHANEPADAMRQTVTKFGPQAE